MPPSSLLVTMAAQRRLDVHHDVCIVSYNMHGFNQGISAMIDLIDSVSPDIFLVQEHWLTPDNLGKFNDYLPDYYGFGISAMVARVEAGPLFGRPFGGALILIKK